MHMEGLYQDNERSLLKKTQHMELPDRNKLICMMIIGASTLVVCKISTILYFNTPLHINLICGTIYLIALFCAPSSFSFKLLLKLVLSNIFNNCIIIVACCLYLLITVPIVVCGYFSLHLSCSWISFLIVLLLYLPIRADSVSIKLNCCICLTVA